MLALALAPRVAATLLAAALLGCGGGADSNAVGAPKTPFVEAVAARVGALPVAETMPGEVRARNQVEIRPELEARVVEVLARGGEAVTQGQVLVRLDEREARDRLRQAEADVRLAEAAVVAARARAAELASRVARSRALNADGLVSAQELETLEAQAAALEAAAGEAAARVEQAQAAAGEQRSALDKTVVRSPVAGRLGERRVEIGMRVEPSTVLFVVGDLDQLIVEVKLTESMLERVTVGQPAQIESRGGAGEPVLARLARISPFLAADSFTTVGELDVDNRDGRLRPGMFVSVRVLVGESRRATLVPLAALWDDPASGVRGVYLVEQSEGLVEPASGAAVAGAAAEAAPASDGAHDTERSIRFVPVETIAEGGGVAAVSGVDGGAWVVTVGHQLLAPRGGGAGAGTGSAPKIVARVRPIGWERVLALQGLQDEDLLAELLDKQRKVSAALGAAIPASEDEVDRVLGKAAPESPPGGGG